MITIDDVRAQLAWVADTLIPSDKDLGMPSATEAGIVTELIPRALRARDDLSETFLNTLAELPADAPADPLGAIRGLGQPAFDMVTRMIAGAYFLNPAVTAALGYPGQEALRDTPDYDEIAEVTARVAARGPVYIPTPR
ncbi:hypothetical protein GDN83_07160 [Gordonia jinghuaiqii]|uniref:Gluconate 2-dehydrogenase subunit 3 family protein n=1 Tax=Gordonia jinghuaiqii TaxID=2758710 RepID=A0A7D7LSC4_9ACTN|nr:hypothetical protein [Gordonia jinghuaiqii]MCR5977517.1 hypothetical protein [Gordonia jinghuaiqii]QMT02205.1 hypothetical protein H1R19_03235 [Gordonia jinghuaiqii]